MDTTLNYKLKIDNLKVSAGKKTIIDNFSYAFSKHKITAIIGQSGCGKSTLLKSINAIAKEEGLNIEGKLFLDSDNISQMNPEALRKKVGLVFQNPIMLPCSIEKNILIPYTYHFPDKSGKNTCVEKYLRMAALYDECKDNLRMNASKLSGGQQQRLSIARCLCTEPEVIMLDEPCSALDLKNSAIVENLLLKLKESYTILIVTHNLAQAKRIADFVVFMDKGNLVEAAPAKDFFKNPKTDLAKEYITYIE